VDFLSAPVARAAARGARGTGGFVGASAADLAFVTNATMGVNAVLRSLPFAPGDELLTISHVYAACHKTLHYVARRSGARIRRGCIAISDRERRPGRHRGARGGHGAHQARAARSCHESDRARAADRAPGARARGARHRHAGRRRARAGHGAARARTTSAPRITPAIATNGCAPRRARPSCTFGATARRTCIRRSSAMATTPGSTPNSTGPAPRSVSVAVRSGGDPLHGCAAAGRLAGTDGTQSQTAHRLPRCRAVAAGNYGAPLPITCWARWLRWCCRKARRDR
jgi:hypothetical protein